MEKENDNLMEDVEIVTGNGKDLDISRVYDHIKVDKPDKKKKKGVIVPESKNKQKE